MLWCAILDLPLLLKLTTCCDLGQGALHAMTRRHESLRTRFVEAGGRLLQAVLPLDDPRAVPQLQRCSAPVNGNTQALVDLITSLSEAPFEMLGAGVPVRFALITCERSMQPATLFIGMHHVLRSVPHYGYTAPVSMQCVTQKYRHEH